MLGKTGYKESKTGEWEAGLKLPPENSGIQEMIFKSENVSDMDCQSQYDEQYLAELRERAKHWLDRIDFDSWLRDIRGNYEV